MTYFSSATSVLIVVNSWPIDSLPPSAASVRICSLFRDFLRLLVGHVVDPVLVLFQQRLHVFLALVALVFGHFTALFGGVEVLVAVAADVAAGDPARLGRLLDALDHLLALLAAHRRYRQADHLAVVIGRH